MDNNKTPIIYNLGLIILIFTFIFVTEKNNNTAKENYKLIFESGYYNGFVDGIIMDRESKIDSTFTDSMLAKKAKYRYWEIFEYEK